MGYWFSPGSIENGKVTLENGLADPQMLNPAILLLDMKTCVHTKTKHGCLQLF